MLKALDILLHMVFQRRKFFLVQFFDGMEKEYILYLLDSIQIIKNQTLKQVEKV